MTGTGHSWTIGMVETHAERPPVGPWCWVVVFRTLAVRDFYGTRHLGRWLEVRAVVDDFGSLVVVP